MTIIADDDFLKGDLTKLDGNKYNKRDSYNNARSISRLFDYSDIIVNQHLDMARNYLSNMASQLKAMYPNLSQADANALTWGGLETDALALYSGMPQADKNNIEITNKNYKSGKSGTPCQ